MIWNLVQLDGVQATPWRNGGGMTRELAVWPAQGEWLWRMSVAEVQASGPFSCFDGVTRWFAVLQGAGVRLVVNGRSTAIGLLDAPLSFDGAAHTECSLLADATRDFNLMVRDGAGQSHMHRIQGHFGARLNAPRMIAIYAIDTEASVQFDQEFLILPPATLAWHQMPADATVRVECSNALWIEVAI